MNGESNTTPTEEQIREIAREEAKKVNDIEVEDAEGEGWSIGKLMEKFEIRRRTALKAIGLIGLGYGAPRAVLQVISQSAEAAAQDDLTVPGTLSAGNVATTNVSWEFLSSGSGNEREIGTVYQAPSYDIAISVSVEPGSDSTDNEVILEAGTDSNSLLIIEKRRWRSGAPDAGDRDILYAHIPADHYYQVRNPVGSDVVVNQWTELR